MDWKDVPKYGKDGRFITEDEFREVSTEIAATVALETHDIDIGLVLSTYAVLISNELFKDEKEDK